MLGLEEEEEEGHLKTKNCLRGTVNSHKMCLYTVVH